MGFPEEPAESTPRRGRRARGKQETPVAEAPVAEAPTQASAAVPRNNATWSPYDEGSSKRGPIMAAVGGVVVLGLLVGGLAIMWNMEGSSPEASTQRTSAPLPSGPGGKYGYATSRETDPEPLTVGEAFPSKKITVDKRSYEMTITAKDKKCGDAVLGDKLKKALKSAKCTQLLRASFRDKDGAIVATIGVANLSSGSGSTKVARAGSASNYVKPLPGKDTVTKYLGSGSGGAQVRTHGHYAVLYWVQKKDGTKPDKKGMKALWQAVDDFTGATVFKALDARTLTGQPA